MQRLIAWKRLGIDSGNIVVLILIFIERVLLIYLYSSVSEINAAVDAVMRLRLPFQSWSACELKIQRGYSHRKSTSPCNVSQKVVEMM